MSYVLSSFRRKTHENFLHEKKDFDSTVYRGSKGNPSGAEVGNFKWKVEFHGMEWNLMERFLVDLIKTSKNYNGEITQV